MDFTFIKGSFAKFLLKVTLSLINVGSGLFFYDPQSQAFAGLNEKMNPAYIRKSAYVSWILEDTHGSLWIATLFGLYRLNFRQDNLYDVALYAKNDQADSIGSYDIQTIYQDRKKDLWFGTGDYGLARFLYEQQAFKHIRKQDGLISNVIRGILADAKGNLWISSNTAKVEDNSALMVAATPLIIDIDYILEESSREYFGEGYRWLDPVRTQKWNDLADTYEICGPNFGDHTPTLVTRNIQPYHYLRPIPQGQLDALEMSAAEKAAYQNPGYGATD